MKRTLHLTRETLAALDDADLSGIQGGRISDPNIACAVDDVLRTILPISQCLIPCVQGG